jgi:hypothetical protein
LASDIGQQLNLIRRASSGNHAEWMHERIVRSIVDFEKKLDGTQEIGARLISFSDKEIIHIDDVGYWGPDLIIFHGKNRDGLPVKLLQHVSQISILLVALPKVHDLPRRIGFELEKSLGKPSEEGT